MLNDNYIEDRPILVSSAKCKVNGDKCCYESGLSGTAKIAFMCKPGTCNKNTGICDLGTIKEAFSSVIESFKSSSLVEGFSSENVSPTTWVLLVIVIILIVVILMRRQ